MDDETQDGGDAIVIHNTDHVARIAELTDTEASAWEEFDGPDSGVGVDYWYRNEAEGLQAYVVVDQDQVSISVTDEDGEVASTTYDLEGEDADAEGEEDGTA